MEKEKFMEDVLRGKKIDCPCCGRHTQAYARRFHSSMARTLILLYTLGGEKDYVHTSRLIHKGETSTGDFAKAKYWKLITEAENNSDHKRTSGNWKLTEKGVQFVLGRLWIPQIAIVYNDTVKRFEGKTVNIKQCLEDKGFNYSELMKALTN